MSDQSGGIPAPKMQLASPKWCGEWCIGLSDFDDSKVGAKSRSIASLRGAVPDWINLPASVTIPFGSFERALKSSKSNKAKNDELKNALKVNRYFPPTNPPQILLFFVDAILH